MVKLALLGKNISHSKSKFVYESILGKKIDFSLIESSEEEISSNISIFLDLYDGINVTAPFKKFCFELFNSLQIVNKNFKKVGSINCVSRKNGITEAHNTDFISNLILFNAIFSLKKFNQIIILGDGATSNMVSNILEMLNHKFTIFSRRQNSSIELSTLDLTKYEEGLLVVNCCSREFLFKGKLPKQSVFLDQNYQHLNNQKNISNLENVFYIDGGALLCMQAFYSLIMFKLIK